MAKLLQVTNCLTEAESLFKRALAIDQRSFGADHPKIAVRLNGLAKLFQATNRLSEAEPMMCRALEILLASSAANGREHRHLSAAIGNYKAVLEQMGYTEAQIIAELDKVRRPCGIQFGSDT